MENIVDYIIGLGVLGIVIGIVYQGIKQADNIVGEPPVVETKPTKLSKARLMHLPHNWLKKEMNLVLKLTLEKLNLK